MESLSTWNFYQFHIYWTLSKIKTKQNFWFKIFQKVEFLGQWKKIQNFNYQISMTKFSIIKHLNFIQTYNGTSISSYFLRVPKFSKNTWCQNHSINGKNWIIQYVILFLQDREIIFIYWYIKLHPVLWKQHSSHIQ